MTAGVVVFAVGNRSRGDDAIGPLLLDRLAAWLGGRTDAGDFELIDDFQLQIEHALDLAGRRLVLFIDAGVGTAAPFDLRAIAATASLAGHSTHALAPQAVLGVYRQITGEASRRRRSCSACAASASSWATDLSVAARAHGGGVANARSALRPARCRALARDRGGPDSRSRGA